MSGLLGNKYSSFELGSLILDLRDLALFSQYLLTHLRDARRIISNILITST